MKMAEKKRIGKKTDLKFEEDASKRKDYMKYHRGEMYRKQKECSVVTGKRVVSFYAGQDNIYATDTGKNIKQFIAQLKKADREGRIMYLEPTSKIETRNKRDQLKGAPGKKVDQKKRNKESRAIPDAPSGQELSDDSNSGDTTAAVSTSLIPGNSQWPERVEDISVNQYLDMNTGQTSAMVSTIDPFIGQPNTVAPELW